MSAATLLAAPYRPALVPLPSDWPVWPELPRLEISIFPFGAVFSGDRLGLDVRTEFDPGGRALQVRLDKPGSLPIAEADFFLDGNEGDWEARLPWVWDTSGQAGWHTLFVNLAVPSAAANGVGSIPRQYPLRILPAARRSAGWRQATSACCDYYYLSGTESERDIAGLIAQTEQIYENLNARMGGASPKLAIVFLPRLYGQGGLVLQEGILSYMDRNITGTDFLVVLEHEMTHLFSAVFFQTDARPPLILQEGWAVYLTGGHYHSPEPLQERAAALIQTGNFAPLPDLADSFYSAQHEAAYIEAGAFVEFLAGRFGHERVLAMYRDPIRADSPGAALDSMLRRHFHLTLAECEAAWLESLRLLAPDPDQVRDVEFTLQMFDMLRSYQQLYDPGGFMFDLWLPDTSRARADRISADYLPSPAATESITLEILFQAARKAAGEGEWSRSREMLEAIGRILEAKQRRVPDPIAVSPLAEKYRRLVTAILRCGFEPLSIAFRGERAVAEIREPTSLEKEVQDWDNGNGGWVRAGGARC